jgi:hypothetical protein
MKQRLKVAITYPKNDKLKVYSKRALERGGSRFQKVTLIGEVDLVTLQELKTMGNEIINLENYFSFSKGENSGSVELVKLMKGLYEMMGKMDFGEYIPSDEEFDIVEKVKRVIE